MTLWTAGGEASDEHDRTNSGRAKRLHLQNGIDYSKKDNIRCWSQGNTNIS